MSLDDWKWDRGWRGTVYELAMLGWRVVAIVISLVIFAVIAIGWLLLGAEAFL